MGVCGGPAVRVLVLAAAWALGGGQVRYSVPEEAKAGTVVGRLAQDLGLEAGEAEARRLRLVAQGRRASVEVSGASGALVVSSRLDREELCGKSAPCALRLEVLVERPLRVFHVELEVTDINDNAPLFPAARKNLSLSENSPPGSRFPLEGASDADIGANAQLSYTLSPSEHFTLDVKTADENRKTLFLVLAKALDRETVPVHRLVLTASDGGRPSLTGTMELVVSVLDVNDNAPLFNQSVYKVQLPESAAEGTLVARVNATDTDLGIYGEVIYEIDTFVPPSASDVFSIDEKSGEIRLTGALDFETVNFYELHVKAKDRGSPPLSGHCSVELEVLDVNDNAPEVWVTSLSVPVAEDAPVGTVVALLSVSDRDSGANGRVRCAVWPAAPFGLVATFAGSYSLVLREALDRERVSEYEVEVRAEDGGAPPLRARRGVRVPVSDVNDNAPAFAQAVYTVLARENNAAGAELARLWARDPDEAGNGRVSYSVWEGGGGGAAAGGGWRAASSYVSVDAESGRLWALQPLDYEEVQVLQFEVRAVDAGEPPLCGNATVQLFVVDENDNAPALLPAAGGGPGPGAAGSAASGPGSGAWWAWAAWGAPAGQVVAKIRAVDADSGYNAWLRYELWEPRGKGPFRVGLYSGEVSTARALEEADGPRQRLVIVVRDHGEPARSATATLSVSLVEGAEAALAAAGSSSSSSPGSGLRAAEGGPAAAAAAAAATNVWLVVAICAVSSLFLLAVVLYGASRWAPRAAVLSGPGPATLVCASEVGSWSYSQRQSRSLCVADGAGKSDLMVFSPNFPPPPGPAAKETQPEPPALLDTVSGPPSFPPSLSPSLSPSLCRLPALPPTPLARCRPSGASRGQALVGAGLIPRGLRAVGAWRGLTGGGGTFASALASSPQPRGSCWGCSGGGEVKALPPPAASAVPVLRWALLLWVAVVVPFSQVTAAFVVSSLSSSSFILLYKRLFGQASSFLPLPCPCCEVAFLAADVACCALKCFDNLSIFALDNSLKILFSFNNSLNHILLHNRYHSLYWCDRQHGDLVQGDDLSAGTGNPWGHHGTCHKKTRMGDDVLVLRMRVPEWGVEDAQRKARGRIRTVWTEMGAVTALITESLRTPFLFEVAEKAQDIQAAVKSLRVRERLCIAPYVPCANVMAPSGSDSGLGMGHGECDLERGRVLPEGKGDAGENLICVIGEESENRCLAVLFPMARNRGCQQKTLRNVPEHSGTCLRSSRALQKFCISWGTLVLCDIPARCDDGCHTCL
ncbi:protocadherin alpha-2-like [Strix aluco]|uniref:protocadherin alpha-2-like n=1 Tax=Strix aluco TaxID=111821 RepID=UPI003DA59E6E